MIGQNCDGLVHSSNSIGVLLPEYSKSRKQLRALYNLAPGLPPPVVFVVLYCNFEVLHIILISTLPKMSLLPILFNDNFVRPSRIWDQHFGLGLDLEDMLSPLENRLLRNPSIYYRPWLSAAARNDAGSTVTADKDKFQVNLDVQQFKPDEITVKVSGKNTVTVEGKHEEKQDEHGFVSRHFVRRYVLPDGHDINQVMSNLSSDGVLSITAPRVAQESIEHRNIPIQQTGAPSKAVEKKE
ncbi:hypothetical protein ILUMI_22203 [Ignelater luminosus]|uniref:SHSP domain-containing protein n=1 Tax=Ignelater luminosus TaxID=2038154 RepID=A0A8K0CHK0_IGNLU|nr:hypothetical protein ILUMI_22203 [Ignelater luminosus]